MTNAHHCAICPRPLTQADTDAGRHACQACAHQLRTWLRELPGQAALLQISLRPDGRPAQGRGGGRAHPPVPLRLDALNLLGPGVVYGLHDDPHHDQGGPIPIRPWLYGWALYIAGEHPSVTRNANGEQWSSPCQAPHSTRGTDAAAWCHWLTAYLPHAITRPWINELYYQLQELLHHLRGITHTAVRRTRKAAPCPACGSLALLETDGEWEITCQLCPHHLTRTQYDDHARTVLAHAQAYEEPPHSTRSTPPDQEHPISTPPTADTRERANRARR